MDLRTRAGLDRSALRFLALFLAWLALLGLLFESAPALFRHGWLVPVSALAAALLRLLSLEALLDTEPLSEGFCELVLEQVVYRVTFDCTGVFALLALTALVLAYPAPARQRAGGLALGLPAVFLFSVLRIVVLGVVAHVERSWIEVFHIYVMELATVGFMLFVWLYWLGQVRRARP